MKPLVSIITPSFNQAPYLRRTMESVLRQDYPNLEYIVVDGGSTDGSQAIIKEYEDRLAHWESVPDRGQTDAINKGFARATGKYLAWLNSDDVYQPGAISEATAYLESHPEVGMVYGDCTFIDADDRQIGRFPAAQTDYGGYGGVTFTSPSRRLFSGRICGIRSGRLTRRFTSPWITTCGCAWHRKRRWCTCPGGCGLASVCTAMPKRSPPMRAAGRRCCGCITARAVTPWRRSCSSTACGNWLPADQLAPAAHVQVASW
jgi:glycosyltransferase involved in cell wall biosynthesis